MKLTDRHVVVTGAAGGIGRALIRRFAQEGHARSWWPTGDIEGARAIAEEVGGLAVAADAPVRAAHAVRSPRRPRPTGAIDIFISNAGVPGAMGGPEADDDVLG